MPFIIGTFTIAFGALFMIVSSFLGLLFIPIAIFANTFFPRTKPTGEKEITEPVEIPVHIPLKRIPSQYYEAYANYLKSPEWRVLRKEVLKRDKYKCVDCGAFGKLQVHHIHYDGVETMTFSVDQCVSVCHDCHDIRHGRDLWK